MHRAVRELPVLGQEIYTWTDGLVTCNDYAQKADLIEVICSAMLKELRNQGLTDSPSDFLLDHGPIVQSRIQNPRLKQRNVWID